MTYRPARIALALIAACMVLLPVATRAEVNQQAIDAVMAGKLKVAKASWWGFDATEATHALQAAIDSKVPKLIVDNVGRPWVVDKISLTSDQEVCFEPGVEVVAKRGAFRGTGDALFTASLQRNVTLYGPHAVLRMWRSDYAKPPYDKGEWRHCLSILSCTNVRVYGLRLRESGGDGIYLGVSKEGVTNRNVLIKRVICDRNYRQGISVISAADLVIEDTVMQGTGGTAPMAGIDFEPNGPTEMITATMRRCVTRGNQGCGYALYLPNLHASSAPLSLRLENCRSVGDASAGLFVATGNSTQGCVQGSMEFVNCAFRRSGGVGIMVSDKPAAACPVEFRHCTVDQCGVKTPGFAPITFLAGRDARRAVGGVTFVDCTVKDSTDRAPLALQDSSNGVGIADVTGRIIVERAGSRTIVPLDRAILAKWMPSNPAKQIAPYAMKGVRFEPMAAGTAGGAMAPEFARVRGRGTFALYAGKGDTVRFGLKYLPVAAYHGGPMPIVVTSPSGAEAKRVVAEFGQEATVAFTAPETGLYRVRCDSGANFVQPTTSTHPLNLDCSDEPVPLISSVGVLYFWVPAGKREFAVCVSGGDPGELVKAAVYDAKGVIVGQEDNIGRRQQFVFTRPAGAPGEVWSLRLDRPGSSIMEDLSIELEGLPPFFAASPAAVLVPER